MARESANQVLRQIQTLFALGTVGGLSDAQLVERFLGRDGAEREDAFAALVQRHGPMVLSVCRRMLPGPADAEDAFQAVFLVLARKAGAVRRVDGLKSWLYGVAVRTAKEARRRSARRRAREGGAMDESAAVSVPDEGRRDLLALLDEEINRLPSRLRIPLMLCELEGASRQDAARQLGLPEWTLSSRLSRGRSLLRDRLARRGVGLGTGLIAALISESASAALSEPLAASTVRLALEFAARGATAGTLPVAVASLAEGVLGMITVAKLKLIPVVTVTTLGAAACLTAGLAWAVGPNQGGPIPDDAKPKGPAVAVEAPGKAADKKSTPRSTQVRGVVLNQAGQPVARAEVWSEAFSDHEGRGVTGEDGAFAFPTRRRRVDGMALLARSNDGATLGHFRYGYNLSKEAGEEPARIVMKPGREVVVRIADAAKAPVPGASVEAAGNFSILGHATTGPDGTARLNLPADAKVEWIVALKPGRGFDYAEFGAFDEYGNPKGGALPTDLPGSVDLTFDTPRTGRIKAVDASGKLLAGVGFTPWLLHRDGRRSQVNYSSRIFRETTGTDGVATFDWLPPTKRLLQFWPVGEGFARRRIILEEGATGTVTARLTRNEAIRGRVVRPDGSPVPGILVYAFGTGHGMDHGQSEARTETDGSYEMSVSVDEAYAVYIDDQDWAAPSHLDVVLREGNSAENVDFKLARGTVVRGTVTVSPGGKPVPGQYINFIESGGQAPAEVREEGDRTWREVQRQFGAMTDAEGRYSIRVGPGTYTVMGPPRAGHEKITVKDEPELVRDYQMPRLDKGPFSGRVAQAGKGIAGASVEIFAVSPQHGIPFTVKTDADGRFECERRLDKSFLFAKSSDGSLGAIVEIGAEDPTVVIEVRPTATATGLLLDLAGKPAANRPLVWGRRIYLDDERRISTQAFVPKVMTDADGRFTLPALVVGQEYNIALERDGRYHAAGVVRPETADSIDLGTLRAGSYRPKSLANAEEMSSFLKDAPNAGKLAPPIEATTLEGKPLKLDDFKGKYVLLDFWATWCGPCIAEIPQLQAVQDAFGKDERFAILSLSVDEKIEEPQKFQEKRQLPWTQAFLGEGIHGPIPATFGIRAIPAFVLVGPDGRIVARGMRGDDIKKEVAKALAMP